MCTLFGNYFSNIYIKSPKTKLYLFFSLEKQKKDKRKQKKTKEK